MKDLGRIIQGVAIQEQIAQLLQVLQQNPLPVVDYSQRPTVFNNPTFTSHEGIVMPICLVLSLVDGSELMTLACTQHPLNGDWDLPNPPYCGFTKKRINLVTEGRVGSVMTTFPERSSLLHLHHDFVTRIHWMKRENWMLLIEDDLPALRSLVVEKIRELSGEDIVKHTKLGGLPLGIWIGEFLTAKAARERAEAQGSGSTEKSAPTAPGEATEAPEEPSPIVTS